MKTIFMGTPDFAVSSLKALLDSKHEVAAVFTRADKPRNRGKKVTFSPVKEAALEHSIAVYQPDSLKAEETTEIIKQINPDCITVAAFGMILPESVLALPQYGCLNVHASLLPKYRGAAPINRCIMEGQTESGITIMQMDKGLDTGDILLSQRVQITPDTTASQLHDILADLGGKLLVRVLDSIGSLQPVKQDDSICTYAAMLTKSECEIDLSRRAEEVNNHIRALADYPCAYTFIGEKRVKVYRAVVGEAPGIPLKCRGGEIITLTEIQPEGGRRMNAAEYLKGNKLC
jgi:methionyl-tRNA formyltransferase